jgi:hypothetical protein
VASVWQRVVVCPTEHFAPPQGLDGLPHGDSSMSMSRRMQHSASPLALAPTPPRRSAVISRERTGPIASGRINAPVR